MQYGDVDFKTLSDHNTNSRMVPLPTHIDGVRANLFSLNARQKITSTMVNQRFFFFFFFFFFFVICEEHRRRSVCASTQSDQPRLLFAARIVTRFYSSKLYSSIGTYIVSPTCQFAESVLSLHVHLFESKIHPVGATPILFLCIDFVL